MRVKIAYTVELEEVESEVSEIMSRAASDLDYAYQEVTRIQLDLHTDTGDLESKVKELDKIRLKLGRADQVLDDCLSILQGLDQAKKQIEEQEDEIQDG